MAVNVTYAIWHAKFVTEKCCVEITTHLFKLRGCHGMGASYNQPRFGFSNVLAHEPLESC